MKGLDRVKKARPGVGVPSDPFVRVYKTGEFVRSYRISPGITIVGRDPEADISLEDRFISRRHFQIEFEGENRLYVQDLQSHNGTFVNGERVTRAPLAHGDRIKLGAIELVITHPASEAQPRIIPFPVVRTESHAEVPRPRVLEPALKSLLMAAIVTTGAAFLAWHAYQWKLKQYRVVVPAPIPTVAPIPETVESPVMKAPTAKPAKIAEKKKLPPTRAWEEGTGQELVDSLNKSVAGIKDQDLGAADRLIASAPSQRSPASKEAPLLHGADQKVFTVEIAMPTSRERPETEKKARAEKAREYDPKKYSAMLKSKIEGVDECYAEHARKEGEAGKISVWFSIGSDGRIQRSGVEATTILNSALMSCILGKISKMRVEPPPWDGFTVTYTFRFGSRQIKF